MSIYSALLAHRTEILDAAHLAVTKAIWNTWRRCGSRQPHEPDLVAGLVVDLPRTFGVDLHRILAPDGIDASLTGVFCHQSPQVRFNPTSYGACEIGDLLLVHVHHASGQTVQNALLLQAKVSHVQPCQVATTDRGQLFLYENWPKFTYVRSGKLSGQSRSVLPPCAHAGAQYLLIDHRPPPGPPSAIRFVPYLAPAAVCAPDVLLVPNIGLPEALVALLSLVMGRTFGPKALASTDGWSQVVWDLLLLSATKTFTRGRSGYSAHPRKEESSSYYGDGALSFSSSTERETGTLARLLEYDFADNTLAGDVDGNGDDGSRPDFDSAPAENPGISVLLVETVARREG